MPHYGKINFALLVTVLFALSCKHQPQPIASPETTDNFPAEVSSIFITRCATSGCHNAASYKNAGGLRLDSWEQFFNGGNNGAVVVPYSAEYSPLMYFINTDSALGPVALPTMPYNAHPLSREEYLTIKDWIARGAPDKNGKIAFADNAATRQKIYMVHQSCDMVAVIDDEKNVVMRYIPIGNKPYPESPTYIVTAPDGRYAYMAFWYSPLLYKIDTYTDSVVATTDLGDVFWSAMHISPDGQNLLLTNGSSHDMIMVNTATFQKQTMATGVFTNPHGVTANAGFDTFYVTGLFGNIVYKHTANLTKPIAIDGNAPIKSSGANTPNPFEIMMSPDYSKYFVTCENTGEVRVMDAHADTLIKVISVGLQPRRMAVSQNKPYLFVSCMEDNTSRNGYKGSVYVIDYNTLSVIKKIEGNFYQPHAITVNDKENTLYIFSRNQNYNGPAPHHSGPCSGRNGYYSVYNITTLAPVSGKRHEVLVDPYVSDVRFK